MSFEDNGPPTFAASVASSISSPEAALVSEPSVEPAAGSIAPMLETPTAEPVPAAPEQAVPEPVEQVSSPEVSSLTFEQYARGQGWDLPEDVDREELYSQAIERIAAYPRVQSELARLQAELESLRSATPPPAPQTQYAPVAEQPVTPAQQAQAARMFQELKQYDQQLTYYVDRDERSGTVKPKPEFGQTAIDAARTINDFHRMEREQAERLLQNPHLLFKDNEAEINRLVEEKTNSIIEARLAAMEQAETQRRSQYEAQQQQQQVQAQAAAWHEENKAKIWKMGPNGKEMVNPFDPSERVLTSVGKVFVEKFNDLYDQYQGKLSVPEMQRLAMMTAEASAPQQAVAPLAAPSLTPAQKQQAFVQQRTAVVPNQEVVPATVDELESHRPGRLSFADWARKMPENQNVMSSW